MDYDASYMCPVCKSPIGRDPAEKCTNPNCGKAALSSNEISHNDMVSRLFKCGGYVIPVEFADRVIVRLSDQKAEIERLRSKLMASVEIRAQDGTLLHGYGTTPAVETSDGSFQAPIAKVTVGEDDSITATMYAPGLPPGDHELFCVPPSAGGQMVPHPAFETNADGLRAALIWLLSWRNARTKLDECLWEGRGYAPDAVVDTIDALCRATWPAEKTSGDA